MNHRIRTFGGTIVLAFITSSLFAQAPHHHRVRGQQFILPKRVEQIQNALIHEGYLGGRPSGKWDLQTREAMKKFQADNGWQTKIVPDARALKKLDLGPDYSNALRK